MSTTMKFCESDSDWSGSDHLLQDEPLDDHGIDTGKEVDSANSSQEQATAFQNSRRLVIAKFLRRRAAIAILSTSILLLMIVGSILFFRASHQPSSKTHDFVQSGNDTASALSAGCVYAFVPGAFVPPQCHDAELEEEFLKSRAWHWFYDEEGQREIPVDEIKATGGPPVM